MAHCAGDTAGREGGGRSQTERGLGVERRSREESLSKGDRKHGEGTAVIN